VTIKTGKARYAVITVVPMVFMAVMTLTASYYLVVRFSQLALEVPAKALIYRLDMAPVTAMAGLGLITVADSAVKWRHLLTRLRSLISTELRFEEAPE
jgi:carbon starvation protein CstA